MKDTDSLLLQSLSALGRAFSKASPEYKGARLEDIRVESDGIELDVRPPGMVGGWIGALSLYIKVVQTSDTHTLLALKLPGTLKKLLGGEDALEKIIEKVLADSEKKLPPGCTIKDGMLKVDHQALAEHLLNTKRLLN